MIADRLKEYGIIPPAPVALNEYGFQFLHDGV